MASRPVPTDISDYVRFGDVAIDRCGQQCQYAVRHLAGEHGSFDLGSDLRWAGFTGDYHKILLHRDDVETFVSRYREHKGLPKEIK